MQKRHELLNFRATLGTLIVAFSLAAPGLSRADAGPVTSPSDARLYETLELDNGLKVVLVSDPEADKAAASLDVFVGSGSDPADRQGLAHFLEHMLFLGTGKYPEAGEYQRYINEHGGSNNAYTAYSNTNYFFDIDPDFLEPALDRFAQFFVAPLFNDEFVQREREVVHSEFESRRNGDGRRVWAAQKAVMNPAHPMSKFSVGSLETLADRDSDAVRDDLIAFWKEHYSADVMALAVLGREPLPILKKWVVERFAAIEDRDAVALRAGVPMYPDGMLPAQLSVVPDKEQRSVTLTFPIPPVESEYRVKPTALITHLLGHEGPGSLLSRLKREGWAEGLSAGIGTSEIDLATFVLSIHLTRDGARSVDEIIDIAFQALQLVRERGIQAWIHAEQKSLADTGFRYLEEQSPGSYVRSLATGLQRYDTEDILRAPYMLDAFDRAQILSYLDYMVPSNVLVTVVSPESDTDRTAPRYGTPYGLASIGSDTVARWRDAKPGKDLALPAPNPFIPQDLALHALESAGELPVRLARTGDVEIWFHNDTSFDTPRGSLYVSVRSPLANDTPRNAVLTQLYVDLVNEQLEEIAYPAHLADLDYHIYKHVRGVAVRISGYNDKLQVLLDQIISVLASPIVAEEKFQIARESLVRSLSNSVRDTPFRQMYSEVRRVVVDPDWTDAERLEAARGVTAKTLEAFIPRLLKDIHVVSLAHGNLTADDARDVAGLLQDRLLAHANAVDVPAVKVVKLPDGERFLRELDIDHNDSAVAVYVQGNGKEYADRARFYLLGQIMESAFYHELRTVRQLGYVVFARALPIVEVPGLVFVIQSPRTGAGELVKEIETFLERFATQLDELGTDELESYKQGLLVQILAADKRLSERSDRYWSEIDEEEYAFDSRDKLAAAVSQIDIAQLREFYRSTLLERPRSRLVVVSNGSAFKQEVANERPTQGEVIGNTSEFKRRQAHFPPS